MLSAFAVPAATKLFCGDWKRIKRPASSEAAKAFREASEREPASGTLLNLGLTEWRRGRAGPAILAWEQVRWIDPFGRASEGKPGLCPQSSGVEAPD